MAGAIAPHSSSKICYCPARKRRRTSSDVRACDESAMTRAAAFTSMAVVFMRFGIRLCFALAAIAAAGALGSAQPQVPAGPLTYERALALATSRNLNVEAARRARALREAAIRTPRQVPNPDVRFQTPPDPPHQALTAAPPAGPGR